jgi:hypothetical protein
VNSQLVQKDPSSCGIIIAGFDMTPKPAHIKIEANTVVWSDPLIGLMLSDEMDCIRHYAPRPVSRAKSTQSLCLRR